MSPAGGRPERAPAFPGAEGFGAYARGGTGGRQILVTTRADTSREGSLRWALEQRGPRIVEFKVGGLFELAARASRNIAYRAAVVAAVASAFLQL